MTKDDIIKLAREAGFLIDTHAQKYQPNCILSTHGLIDENLQRFATLVAAHEREACAKWLDFYDGLNGRRAEAIRERGNT